MMEEDRQEAGRKLCKRWNSGGRCYSNDGMPWINIKGTKSMYELDDHAALSIKTQEHQVEDRSMIHIILII